MAVPASGISVDRIYTPVSAVYTAVLLPLLPSFSDNSLVQLVRLDTGQKNHEIAS